VIVADQSKIVDLATLAERSAALKAAGKRIVLCHGVFDLLHVGHIRHFKEARGHGDVLVVTLTEDTRVNKGPNRPAFPESLRAEALAALADVDYVAISRFPTAVEVIRAVRPDFYAKGPDYKDAAGDVTGGITLESDAVTEVGGSIVFTDDLTFSSSNLLNRHMPAYDGATAAWLDAFRSRYPSSVITDAVKSFAGLKVLVIGEAILDEYIYVDQMGKSAKEPVLAMRYGSREMFAGGSLAIANHLAGFCERVELITFLGDRNAHEDFVRERLQPNVDATFLYKHDSPSIVKRRYVESYLMSKLFEVYEINDEPLDDEQDADFCALLDERVGAPDVVLVCDFGHGMLSPRAIRLLTKRARFLAVNTQINAANVGFHTISRYKRADYVCVHEGEIRLDARSRRGDMDELVRALADRLDCDNVLVTRGRRGVTLYNGKHAQTSCPAFATSVVDRIGSGDAVLALTSMAVARGLPPEVTTFLANVVGAQAVQIVGNRSSIERVPTIKFIEAMLK
jgi:rfaE bifunctional protein kinase chain/domain/rfaE bifunctional protein nucleotidyltransferase chain/domain